MAQNQVMPVGWDPIDPIRSVKVNKVTGQFQSLSKASTSVPGNVLTEPTVCVWRSERNFSALDGRRFGVPGRIPHNNKGKCIVDNFEMATVYFTPKKRFMEYEIGQFLLTDEGKNASRADKTKHRQFLKEHYKQLPKDILDVYHKKARGHGKDSRTMASLRNPLWIR
jgi:hypothetical protein